MSIRSSIGSVRSRCTDPARPPRLTHRVGPGLVLLLAVVLLVAPGARGQEIGRQPGEETLQRYRVEIVIFQHLQRSGRGEDPGPPPMPSEPQISTPGVVVERAAPLPQALPPDEPQPRPIFFEPADPQDLSAISRTLARRSAYRVLVHESWIQPGFARADSLPVDVRILERLRGLGDRSALPAAPAPEDDAGPFSASVTLWVGRYLHLDLEAESRNGAGVERLSESRRMRSGEVHYFDSPALGAIGLIVPVEPEGPTADEPADGAT